MTRLVLVVAMLGTVGIIGVGLLHPAPVPAPGSARGAAVVGSAVGDVAPAFTLRTLDGREVSLQAFRGEPLLLNFWYATCPGCLQESSALQQFYARQQASGKAFAILGVNGVDDRATAAAFVRQHSLTYPVALDSNQQIEALYNVSAAPTSYFLDRAGIIRAVILGPLDETMLQQEVQRGHP